MCFNITKHCNADCQFPVKNSLTLFFAISTCINIRYRRQNYFNKTTLIITKEISNLKRRLLWHISNYKIMFKIILQFFYFLYSFSLKHGKLKYPFFGRAAFSYLAVQSFFDILTSPGHWATLGN